MIDLEVPRKLRPLIESARLMAEEAFRPISRKYDLAEHTYPQELDLIAAVIDGMSSSGVSEGAGASSVSGSKGASSGGERVEGGGAANVGSRMPSAKGEVRNGANMSSVLSILESCRGDVGLLLSLPRQGLGNAAIAAVASPEQRQRYAGRWAAMAITEPDTGSDSGAIRTTAVRDGDEYVLN
ncbi:MAG TPA: acyl-CoA dehydrogenase, partial [Phycicoccus sp.]|nr:acyl-CoA dehydrogenase [Phycicoccus sp.]